MRLEISLILALFVGFSREQPAHDDLQYLKKELDQLKTEEENLRANMANLEVNSTDFLHRLEIIEQKNSIQVSIMKNDMRYLEQENKKLSSTVSAIQNDMQYLRHIQQTEKAIRAFTVVNSKAFHNVPTTYTVIFDRVLTNEGRRYDAHSGVFTADVSGLYIFLFNIRVQYYNQLCYSELVRNNNKVVVTMSLSGTKFHQHSSESNFGIINLVTGDKIWVRSSPLTETGQTCSIDDSSSFSGYLLNLL